MDDLQKMEQATKMANIGLHAEVLNIPLLNGFNVKENNNPQVILLAMHEKMPMLEQVIGDGSLVQGETFEDRIDKVINVTTDFMTNQGYVDSKKNYFYYKDLNNGTFNFKVYVQDMIINNKITRSINAFFVEPRFNDFYQISLSLGHFPYPTKMLKVGMVDLVNDQITKMLIDGMDVILNNFAYKD